MQFSKDQDFFLPRRVLKKSTIESDMKDDNCLKRDVWIKQWNVSTYPGYWILVMMSRRQTESVDHGGEEGIRHGNDPHLDLSDLAGRRHDA